MSVGICGISQECRSEQDWSRVPLVTGGIGQASLWKKQGLVTVSLEAGRIG